MKETRERKKPSKHICTLGQYTQTHTHTRTNTFIYTRITFAPIHSQTTASFSVCSMFEFIWMSFYVWWNLSSLYPYTIYITESCIQMVVKIELKRYICRHKIIYCRWWIGSLSCHICHLKSRRVCLCWTYDMHIYIKWWSECLCINVVRGWIRLLLIQLDATNNNLQTFL